MIIIDDFLTDPDRVREDALDLTYTQAQPDSNGWKGFRCLYTNMVGEELTEMLHDKLIEFNFTPPLFLRCYFHYTVKEDMTNTTHTDGSFDFAGVLYLSPNPVPDSGTIFFNDNDEEIDYVENVYNRLIIYPSNIRHRIKESFGNSKTTGRLVYTIFFRVNFE